MLLGEPNPLITLFQVAGREIPVGKKTSHAFLRWWKENGLRQWQFLERNALFCTLLKNPIFYSTDTIKIQEMEKLEVTLRKLVNMLLSTPFFEIVFDFYTSEVLMGKGEKKNKNICTYVYKHLCIYLYIKYKLREFLLNLKGRE